MTYNNYPPSLISLKMIHSMQSTRRGGILGCGGILGQTGFRCPERAQKRRLKNGSNNYDRFLLYHSILLYQMVYYERTINE